jgi:hypothetical protein
MVLSFMLAGINFRLAVNTYSGRIYIPCCCEILLSLVTFSSKICFPFFFKLSSLINLDSSVRRAKIRASACVHSNPWIHNYWGASTIKGQPYTRNMNTTSKHTRTTQLSNWKIQALRTKNTRGFRRIKNTTDLRNSQGMHSFFFLFVLANIW